MDNTFHKINVLGDRLKKIDIKIRCGGNYPWIYLDYINDIRVKEKTHDSNHGFNIAWLPVKKDKELTLTNTKEMFELIRKYTKRIKGE